MYKLLIILLCMGTLAKAQDVTHYVQPMAGTAAATTASALKHGGGSELLANTIPAVTIPFGMTQWTPQTRTGESKCVAPYYYKDSLFYGIRGSHWLSGSCTQDYGSFTIMPVTDKGIPFKHTDERSTPYAYYINLQQVQVAVTSTARCGLIQFTMNESDSLHLFITHVAKVDTAKREVYGYNPAHRIYQGWGKPAGFSGYFVVRFDKDFSNNVGFKMSKGEKLVARIGTSFTSIEGARKNLDAEAASIDFDAAVASCKAIWQEKLGQIKVETGNEVDKEIFYTSYYHAMQQPRLFNDVDGLYPMFSSDYKNARLIQGNYYDDFSMWDIYRAEIPLFEILDPPFVNNLVQSLILKGKQGGWMPIFPCWNSYTSEMIGDHATSVISSAYLKGIRNYNVNEAYQILRQNAFDIPANRGDYVEGKGRRALDSYLKYHYIPLEDSVKDAFHKQEQVSRVMEYAYDDYALAQFAKALNKTADYTLLMQRAKYYRNVFDKQSGMVRGRHADGSWITPYKPDAKAGYITEGTPRQYTFYVPHDVSGLNQLMNGQLESALDSLFSKGEYWHGNEPGHQIPFMYNYTASPWKTQQQVRKILAEEYSNGAGGLGGNDDAGQMSAWYLFASMGFYPVNPVSGEYLLCTPLFSHVTVRLPQGKTFEIICHNKGKYIHQAKWNGIIQPNNFISYSNIMKGGKLELYLQDTPDKAWGSKSINQPKGIK